MISFAQKDNSAFINENSFYSVESMYYFDPRDILITKDTFADHRFHKDKLVIESPHIRFYAELPIVVNKTHVATLSLLDQEKRLAFGLIEQKSLLQVAIMVAQVYTQSRKFEGGSVDNTAIERGKGLPCSSTMDASLSKIESPKVKHRFLTTKEEYRLGVECNLLQVLHSTKCMLGTVAGNIRKIQWVLENSILSEYHRHICHTHSIMLVLLLIYEHLLKYWIKMTNDISFRVCEEKISVLDPPAEPPPSQCYIVGKKVSAKAESPSEVRTEVSVFSTTSGERQASPTLPCSTSASPRMNAPLSRNRSTEPALPAVVKLAPQASAVRSNSSGASLPSLPGASPRATPRDDGKKLQTSSSVIALPSISPRLGVVRPSSRDSASAERMQSSPSQGREEVTVVIDSPKSPKQSLVERIGELKHHFPRTDSQLKNDSATDSGVSTNECSSRDLSKSGGSAATTFGGAENSFNIEHFNNFELGSKGREWSVRDRDLDGTTKPPRSRAGTDSEKDQELVGYVVIAIVASAIDFKSHLAPLSGLTLDIGQINDVLHHIDGHMWATECGPESANSLYEIWVPCTLVGPHFQFQTIDMVSNLSDAAIAQLAVELNAKVHEADHHNAALSGQSSGGGGSNASISSGTSRSGSLGSQSRNSSINVVLSRSNSESNENSNSAERGPGSMKVPSPTGIFTDGGTVSGSNKVASPPREVKKECVKVLVIEDSLIVQKLFVKLMKTLSCEVKLAKNGKIGLEMLKTNDFDIAFMDFLMPVQDGLTTMRLFKEWLAGGRVRDREFLKEAYIPGLGRNEQMLLIGISDIATEEEFLKAQQLDMHFFCKKPVSNALISSIIEASRSCDNLEDTLERVNASAEKTVKRNNWSFFSWAKGKLFEQH